MWYRLLSVPEKSCQRVITHTAELRVLQNSKSRIRDVESARDLSDPNCEMENGSPAKPSRGSCVGQIYIIKRINTRHSPSTSQPRPHGPDAHMHFILSAPLSEPHMPQVRYLALNNADSAINTLKVAELLSDFLVKKSAEQSAQQR